MKKIAGALFILGLVIGCTTDFAKTEIKTSSIEGFIVGGDASGVYGEASLLIRQDSLRMTDWQMSRLVKNLNIILDKEFTDQSEFPGFYTIQLANTGDLNQIEFCDSIAAILIDKKLIK